jgi:hypothetical protein
VEKAVKKGVGDKRFSLVLVLLFVTDPFIRPFIKTTPPTGGTKRYSA